MTQRRIQAQLERAQEEGWFAQSELLPELREGAARRLGVLGLLTACTFVFFVLLHMPEGLRIRADWLHILISGVAIVVSLLLFGASRKLCSSPGRLLMLGRVYQVAMALIIGLLAHLAPWASPSAATTTLSTSWSGVAVWIIIFSAMVPDAPRRTLWLASVTALMDPLTLLVTIGLGSPTPPPTMLPLMFGPTAVAVLTAVVSARINHRLGRRIHEAQEMGSYKLVELLGRGGMGEVWRAEHKMLVRPAAIKLIRADALKSDAASSDQEAIQRFEREAQATALLQSEHTIELYDFGVAGDGSLYYVMELLDGLDLEQLVRRHGVVSPQRAVFLLRQVCDSLAEAHDSGLVHRDIKPSNIYVCKRASRYDCVKVLDFGLVKPTLPGQVGPAALTAQGSITGTPAFMVPEIIQGSKEVDGRADLYAVGCVAYWLISGRLVFEADNAMKMIVSHVSDEPVRLSARTEAPVPAALEQLVHDCLEKDPARRPQNARELAERLAAVDLGSAWTQERAKAWWEAQREPMRPDETVDPLETTAPH